MWPAIIAGGASILSSVLPGLLNKTKSPGQVPYEHIRNSAVRNALALVEAGKQSGIHPLALLGSGVGGGGFAQPVGGSQFGLGDAIGAGLQGVRDAAVLYQQDADALADREERAEERRYRRDYDERAQMDRVASDVIAGAERDKNNALIDAQIRMLDSESMLNAARSRSELARARAQTLGATTGGPLDNPGTVVLPYTGTWKLAPGTSSAGHAQQTIGEPMEWQAAIENYLWNFFHDPDSSRKMGTKGPGYMPRAKDPRFN